MNEYSAASIEVLDEREAIRRRPGMYVGDVRDGSGLHHLLWEVLGNALDEHLAGRGRSVEVTLHEGGGVTVDDDGEGIPVEIERGGVSFLEIVLTKLHFGGTFDGHSPHLHLSTRGVGLVAVNVLSLSLEVEVFRHGKHYRQAYRRGRPEGPVEIVGEADRQGTRLAFTPDPAIFEVREFDASLIAGRLRELAFLFPGLDFRFADGRKLRFCYEAGVADYVAYLNRLGRRPRHEPVVCRGGQGQIKVEAALQWSEVGGPLLLGFVNGLRTVEGGTHIEGLSLALVGMVVEQTGGERPRNAHQRRRIVRAMSEGLSAVVSVQHHDPAFNGGSARTRLTSPEVTLAVVEAVAPALRGFCREQPGVAAAIVEAARQRLT